MCILGKHQPGASPSALGSGQLQPSPARHHSPPWNSSVPKCEIPSPEKGILLQGLGSRRCRSSYFGAPGRECPSRAEMEQLRDVWKGREKKAQRETNPARFLLPQEVINVLLGDPGMLINLHRQTKTLTSIKYC